MAKAQPGHAKRKGKPVGRTDIVAKGNLPSTCETDVPIPRRMRYFLFSKICPRSLLDLIVLNYPVNAYVQIYDVLCIQKYYRHVFNN